MVFVIVALSLHNKYAVAVFTRGNHVAVVPPDLGVAAIAAAIRRRLVQCFRKLNNKTMVKQTQISNWSYCTRTSFQECQ